MTVARTTPDDGERGTTPDDRERGSMHVMAIPVAVGMVTVAVLVVTMLGSATDGRREAGTAADAAALAATQEWDEHLGLLHGLHLGVSEPEEFWGLAEEALLSQGLQEEMYEAAEAYAEGNGAELVGFDVDPERLQVTVRVEHDEAVPGTAIRPEASATAGITLRGGLCVDGDGLGWLIDGLCLTEPEDDAEEEPDGDVEEEPDEGDDEENPDEGDDEEDWTAPEVDGYSSSVVLVG
jgi:hypothetical protein